MAELLDLVGQLGSLGTAFGTIALVILFWRVIKQMDETVKLSRVQTDQRFRPWVGPYNKIHQIGQSNGKMQYDITIKNYGEIPSTNVKASFVTKDSKVSRDDLKNPEHEYDLGPLLPNMEKHYWFFIDSQQIEQAGQGKRKLYIGLHFSYEYGSAKKSGYGLISRYSTESKNFIHEDMWVG